MGVLEILMIVAIVVSFLALSFSLYRANKDFHDEYGSTKVKDIKYNEDKQLLQFKGGLTGSDYTFHGNCTVWRYIDGQRCSTSLEIVLSEIWHKWKIDNNK